MTGRPHNGRAIGKGRSRGGECPSAGLGRVPRRRTLRCRRPISALSALALHAFNEASTPVGPGVDRRPWGAGRRSRPRSGHTAFARVTQPQVVGDQRVAALPFADPRVQALVSVLVLYCLLPQGFATKDVRPHLAALLGLDPSALTPGTMTDDLRRLRLHRLIARVPPSHRYRVTDEGLCTALLFTRVYARILRPGLARIAPAAPPGDTARPCGPISRRWRKPLTAGLTRRNASPKRDSFARYVRLQDI